MNDQVKTNHSHRNGLTDVIREEPEIDPEYEKFKAEFFKRTGFALDLYKENQMKRRITTFMKRKNLDNYQDFLSFLDSSSFEMNAFLDYLTIHVTGFFRTPLHWQIFEEKVLKELVKSPKEKIRIWCCACSTGEEPYSVAMSLASLTNDISRFEIIASDINEDALARAKKAEYSEMELADVPENAKERFFVKLDKTYQVKEDIRSMVTFQRLDLLQQEYPQELDVILARNILIYFTDAAKEIIYNQFRTSLVPGGYLFTGKAEQIIYYRRFGLKKITSSFYQRVSDEPEETKEKEDIDFAFVFDSFKI